LTAGCAWSLSSDQSWLGFFNQTSGTGNATITYAVGLNGGSAARTGRITASGAGGSAQLTVTQDAPATCGYSFFPSDPDSVTSSGGSRGRDVKSNCDWTASSSQPWLHVSTSSGSGNGRVNYDVDPNTGPGADNRTGVITISGRGGSATLTVSQSFGG
jgi:hypothetical protein